MVCKVHVEFQKAFSGWLDGAVKDPPKIAVLPGHLQALIDDEVVMVKRVHEFQRRFSGRAAIAGSGRRGEEAQPELKKPKKKKKKKRDRDDADGAPAKAGKPASKGASAGGAGGGVNYMDALWKVSTKNGAVLKDKEKKGACLKFIQTGRCAFGAACRFSHDKDFWQKNGVTWRAVRAAASGDKDSDSGSEEESRARSRSRSPSRRGD
ncbi:hypothetical protein SO694_0026302 [Aureococcus anophagefferens]|uniref:C3H1-type domain-containing protein n=1 Tax=Aureococcus anophagefferens TaxID=44056 RepID=A0ABR1G8G5_AURAN